MLTLQKHFAKISNFNPRAEKNGDANVLAGDIKVEACCARSVMDQFDESLRPLLFRVPGNGETLVKFNDGDGATGLRLPKLQPLRWDEEFPGCRLTVHSGLGLIEPLVIEDVALSGFSFEALEGGSVKVGFRASCHPDQEQSGALCELIQETVEISIEPPAKDSRQTEMATEPAGDAELKPILIAKVEATFNKSRHQYSAAATDTNGAHYKLGELSASRPTLDQVAVAIFDIEARPVEFTPACRNDYEAVEA